MLRINSCSHGKELPRCESSHGGEGPRSIAGGKIVTRNIAGNELHERNAGSRYRRGHPTAVPHRPAKPKP